MASLASFRRWLTEYSLPWIDNAIREAALNKAKSIKYVDAILKAWRRKYRDDEQPWLLDRCHNQRASPGGKSFAMTKLERMARDAIADETRTKEGGSHDTH